MERKYYKILIVFVVVVLLIKLVPPIIDEYGAKGKREPLYVRKSYRTEIDKIIRPLRKNESSEIPKELKEKYFLKDIYVYPYIFSSAHGEQIEKSGSSPYSFNIFAKSFEEDKVVIVSNVRIKEKTFFFLNKEIFILKDEKELYLHALDNEYVELYNYSEDLNVSQIYMKPLIVAFDVSTELDGKIVTKSMEYIMEPVIEKGIQKPIWMYQ